MKINKFPEIMSSLSRQKQEDVLCVFGFWNSYKGQGGWASHRKLTHDIVQAIIKSLTNYSVEDVCIAIHNYSTILIGYKYYWDYVWPLSIFLTVGCEKRKDAPRKWWQFLPENFVAVNYLKDKEIEVEDIDSELTQELVKKFRLLTNNKMFEPSVTQRIKFVKATKKMHEFFGNRYTDIGMKVQVDFLFHCLYRNYIDRGEVLYPGHLCSENLWEILLPQYLLELGVE